MHFMFVDESGTHGHDAHAFVLGGLALHENDAAQLQSLPDELVIKHLGRVPVNLEEYELHANEMRNAKKPRGSAHGRTRIWATGTPPRSPGPARGGVRVERSDHA